MRSAKSALIICTIMFTAPFAGIGAEGADSGMTWSDAFKVAVPPLLIFGVVMLVFAILFRSMKKNPMTRRYEEHMDRVESLLARIADTLDKNSRDENKP